MVEEGLLYMPVLVLIKWKLPNHGLAIHKGGRNATRICAWNGWEQTGQACGNSQRYELSA